MSPPVQSETTTEAQQKTEEKATAAERQTDVTADPTLKIRSKCQKSQNDPVTHESYSKQETDVLSFLDYVSFFVSLS